MLIISMSSCDNGDDLSDIFLSHSWKLSFFYEGGKRTSPPENTVYSMKFYDTSFVVTTKSGATITGNWKADNKKRTFSCSNIKTSDGSINNDTIATKMRNMLQEARFYEGDSNWLQIQVQNNKYMQFHNK